MLYVNKGEQEILQFVATLRIPYALCLRNKIVSQRHLLNLGKISGYLI